MLLLPTKASGSGGGSVETPSGTMNGVNKIFTVTATPKWITWNGQSLYDGSGYTISTLTVTLDTAPQSGDTLRSHY